MDNRTLAWTYKLKNYIEEAKREQEQRSDINKKYLWRSYGISLVLTIFANIIFALSDNMDVSLSIVYFVLFPYAKIVYDILIGFKFSYKGNKQGIYPIYFMQLHYLLLFLVYIFCPVWHSLCSRKR